MFPLVEPREQPRETFVLKSKQTEGHVSRKGPGLPTSGLRQVSARRGKERKAVGLVEGGGGICKGCKSFLRPGGCLLPCRSREGPMLPTAPGTHCTLCAPAWCAGPTGFTPGIGTRLHSFKGEGSSGVTWAATRQTPTLEGTAWADHRRPPGGQGARLLRGGLLSPRRSPASRRFAAAGTAGSGHRGADRAARRGGRRHRPFPGPVRAGPGGSAPGCAPSWGKRSASR